MADERIAELIAQSNVALADSLAKALQGVRGQSAPNVQLSKFVGHPRKSGDPTLSEWLEEYEIYTRQRAIPEEEQAMTLLDHLGGSARDEVLCHPLSVRQDLASLTTLLRVRFGPPESIASLNAAFHSRCQLEGESLAEYSRVLMRIHDRMEQSAASLVESQALALLRDNALKEQFVRGVREQSIRQELRRIVLGSADGSFHDVRNEALCLFQEHEERSRSMRVRTTKVEPARFADGAVEACAWESNSGSHDPVVSQMMHTQQQMQTQMQQLMLLQRETSQQVQSMLNRSSSPPWRNRGSQPQSDPRTCFYCKQPGHFIRECPKKREADQRAQEHTSLGN